MKTQDKFSQFLEYSQFIYNYLSINHIQQLKTINSCQWLQSTKTNKSSFKFLQNYICLAGSDANLQNRGILCIYYTKIPKIQEMDDDRLVPSVVMKSRFQFERPVMRIQQFMNMNLNSMYNGCLALSMENCNDALILPIYKSFSDKGGVRSEDYLTLKGHTAPINRIRWGCYKDNDHKLFTASEDKSIIQWNLQKNCQQITMKYHRQPINDIALIHNGDHNSWQKGPQLQYPQILASASSDGYIFLWDPRQNNPINKINCKQKQLFSITCVSRNSFLSGGIDGTLKFWDLRQHRQYCYDNQKTKLQSHKSRITNIKMLRSPTYNIKQSKNPTIGKIKFATGSDDGKIILWQEKNQFTHEGHFGRITDFDYERQFGYFVSACKSSQKIMIWQEGITMGVLQ